MPLDSYVVLACIRPANARSCVVVMLVLGCPVARIRQLVCIVFMNTLSLACEALLFTFEGRGGRQRVVSPLKRWGTCEFDVGVAGVSSPGPRASHSCRCVSVEVMRWCSKPAPWWGTGEVLCARAQTRERGSR